jgi:hypothetical protein
VDVEVKKSVLVAYSVDTATGVPQLAMAAAQRTGLCEKREEWRGWVR